MEEKKTPQNPNDTRAITCHLPQEDQCLVSWQCLPPPTTISLVFLLLSMRLYGMEYPFDQFGSTVKVVSTQTSCSSLFYLMGWRGVGKRESLRVVQAWLSNSQNTNLWYTFFQSEIRTTAPYRLLYKINSIPARLSRLANFPR